MDRFLAPSPMHRALLQVITGLITLARGDEAAAAQNVLTARDALRSARYEDQRQLPLARLEILLALEKNGPAAGLAATSQNLDRYDLSGSTPGTPGPWSPPGGARYSPPAGRPGWPATSGSATRPRPWPGWRGARR